MVCPRQLFESRSKKKKTSFIFDEIPCALDIAALLLLAPYYGKYFLDYFGCLLSDIFKNVVPFKDMLILHCGE